jgi:hypothetical protein
MKSMFIACAAAAGVVGLYALFATREAGGGGPLPEGWRGGVESPDGPGSKPSPPVEPVGASREPFIAPPGGLEGEHLKRGALGVGVKGLLAATIGANWRMMDRLKAAEAVHAIVASYKPEDAPYLLEVFRQTKDPAFRWWFAALVRQLRDDQLADALLEVYRIDPVQASETMGAVGGPRSMSHLTTLIETQPDSDVRGAMFAAVAGSAWREKSDYFARIAGDERRPDPDRMHALVLLGRLAGDAQSLSYLVDVALGPARPVKDLGNVDPGHPVKDLRSAAVMGAMQRGDPDAARKLMDAADAPSADATLRRLVDDHLATYVGPDLSEFLYSRIERRRRATTGELLHIQRNFRPEDEARLRAFKDFEMNEDARRILSALTGGK